MASWSGREQLLEELRAGYLRLKSSPSPIRDGQAHLVPFCETLENILGVGLKQPGSFLRVTKRDYWDWIEVLPTTSLCNAKQNPLLTDAVEVVQKSDVLKSPRGRGRCFLRMALVRKLIPIPVEHLLKNPKLLTYWYNKDSVIHQEDLASQLVHILFEITELDFELEDRASFLDETWIIPRYVSVELEPCQRLGLKLVHMRDRVLVDGVVKGSIVDRSQIEAGDIVDELNGVRLFGIKVGQAPQILSKHTGVISMVIAKGSMGDGTPFAPAQLRQIQVEAQKLHPAKSSRRLPAGVDRPDGKPENPDDMLRFDVVMLGGALIANPVENGAIDAAIHRVLEGTGKPEVVHLCLERHNLIVASDNSDGKALLSFPLGDVAACARGIVHRTCFGFAGGDPMASELTCYVFETPSDMKAKLVVKGMVAAFQRSTWFVPPPPPAESSSGSRDEESEADGAGPGSVPWAVAPHNGTEQPNSSPPGPHPSSGADSPSPVYKRGEEVKVLRRGMSISRSSEQLCDPVLRRSWNKSFYGSSGSPGSSSCEEGDGGGEGGSSDAPVFSTGRESPDSLCADRPTPDAGASSQNEAADQRFSDFEVISEPETSNSFTAVSCSSGAASPDVSAVVELHDMHESHPPQQADIPTVLTHV